MTSEVETKTAAHVSHDRAQWRRLAPVLSMFGAVLLGAALPAIRTPNFYYWDDTAAAAVGVWRRIGEQVLSGQLPFLQLDMWRGGNFIAEAATGMWNPVMLGLMAATAPIDDVAIAITLAKVAMFLIMAGGVFVLARGYGATPWLAAVAGSVMPLSGWALFVDGSSWINGTAILAFTPWAWWAIRRTYLRRFTVASVMVAVVAGYVVASVGNPYGMVTLAASFLAVAVEALAKREYRWIVWLVGLGVALMFMSVIVYLPFLLTSSVGFRAESGVWNDEFLSPGLSDLLGISVASYKPYIQMFGLPYMTIPAMYLAWFILPVLPWLRWRDRHISWVSLSGVLAFGTFFLIFVLGPSQFGMFRWPARLIPFLYLAVLIVIVVVMSAGLHRDRVRLRTTLSILAVGIGAWQAFSDVPELWKWHGVVSLVTIALLALLIRVSDGGVRGFSILAGGMVLLLVPQVIIAPFNGNVANYDFPRSQSQLTERFGDRYEGLTVQVADFMGVPERLSPDRAWRDVLGGNMYSVAGVESTSAYSGVGFTAHDAALCLTYNGGTCPSAWRELWQVPEGAAVPLADLMGVQTVVVMRSTLPSPSAPDGWTLVERTDEASVFQRDVPVSFANSRLTVAGADVDVASTEFVGAWGERAIVSTTQGGDRTVTFARLAWPGYSASVNGESVAVTTGPAGLLQVELPAELSDAVLDIRFQPPGIAIGLALMLFGVVGAAGICVLARRHNVAASVASD